jgi:hydroxypyruvate isomerase
MAWALRYAPHLGYVPPERTPLFQALAGSDPAAHVRLAADEGMAGVLDPWAADRPEEQRDAIAAALKQTGLVGGCVVSTPMATLMQPIWTGDGTDETLQGHIGHALQVAADYRATNLAVLLLGDGRSAPAAQRRRAIDRLLRAADIASKRGVTLVIEPIVVIPGMLLANFADGVELVLSANHPGIKLIFDTGHVNVSKEPLLKTYAEAYDDIAVLQLADMPGRVEPGAGDIDFASILAHAIRKGYSGLVELEYGWTEPGPQSERRGLEALRALDAQAQADAMKSSNVH